MEEFEEQLDRIAKLPWRTAAIAAAAGFVTATLLGLAIGQFILPTDADMKIERRVQEADPSQIMNKIISMTLTDEQVEQVIKRNIFNSEGKYPDEDTQADEENDGRLVESTLPLKLNGTISGGDPFIGIAIIENKEKNLVNSFMVGDVLLKEENAILAEIYPQKIILTHNGRREFIKVDVKNIVRVRRKAVQGGGKKLISSSSDAADTYVEDGFERKGTQVRVTAAYKSDLLGPQLAKVLRDAKAVPSLNPDGSIRGWSLTNIRPDSIYLKMGLKEGDVVTDINGYSLTDAPKAVKVLKDLQKEDKFRIRIERGGAPFDLNMGAE